MRPALHPQLVNGRFGDPALFVERLHRRDAILFDLGDLHALSARDLLRVGHVFVSHVHMDHFIGFDALLRILVGRERTVQIAGPEGLCDRVWHKLQAYEWDLAHRYATELIFDVTELGADAPLGAARFRFTCRFVREDLEPAPPDAGEGLELRWALLEHHGPCLGFAIAERAHANVWRNRLDDRGLPSGAWLQELKRAVLAGLPDDHRIMLPDGDATPLGGLRDLVTLSRGQKLAYVTDVADTPANRAAIAALAEGADLFFLESRFAAADADQARDRAHLTTRAAGEIARAAGVRRLEPFHFSPRYVREEERLLAEVAAAFGATASSEAA